MKWVGLDGSRTGARAVGLLTIAALVALLVSGSAVAAGPRKVVEGTVYDSTCGGVSCGVECPPPPHCGPITAGAKTGIVCPMAKRLIACPLSRAGTIVCLQAEACPGTTSFPLYSGEGGVVKVRKRGSEAVLATVPIVEGHFKVKLTADYYELRPSLPEPECWSGTKLDLLVSAKAKGPVPAGLWVENKCVAHPDSESAGRKLRGLESNQEPLG